MEIQTGIQIRRSSPSPPGLVKNVFEPRFLLLYAPQRHDPTFGTVKPEVSLGNLYLAAALEQEGFEVDVLDCCIGDENKHSIGESFDRITPLSNGMVRVGLSPEAILKEAAGYDVIGISSIFTPQTYMVEELVRLISRAFPEKIIIMGGINARSQMNRFFNAGAYLICISEAERTIVEIGKVLRTGSKNFSNIDGVAFVENGKVKINPLRFIEDDLDKLPIPARHKLPLKRIAEINRPHGGSLRKIGTLEKPNIYVSMMTSRGCPYKCDFCHISGEQEGSITGNIGKFRWQSEERVEQEIVAIKKLGTEYIYIEDDSFLARKKRALAILKMITKYRKRLGDVNGVNLSHLHKNDGNGKIIIDEEMLETMAEAGFDRLSFPVESGSQRIINRWVSGKISHDKYDISALIKKANSLGITVSSCYLIGYPDETYEELAQTYLAAQRHRDAGSEYVNFTIVTPFPGTALYEHVIQNNLLLPGIDIADLDWMRPSIKTVIDPIYLEFFSRKAWEFVNKPERIAMVRSMAPKVNPQ